MNNIKKYMVLGGAVVASIALVQTAEAAFEWRGMPAQNTTVVTETVVQDGPPVSAVPVMPVEQLGNFNPTPITTSPTPVMGGNIAVGQAPEAYRGFGRDIPLDLAVRQITPDGFLPVFGAGIDTQQTVSWTGDGQWDSTLDKVLNQKGLKYTQNGSRIEISKQMAPSPQPISVNTVPVVRPVIGQPEILSPMPRDMAVIPPRNTMPVTNVSVINQPVPITRSVQQRRSVPVMQGQWTAGVNETLRETLSRWSAQNGTNIYWTIDYDYRLKEAVSLQGSYIDAVQSLLDAFKKVAPRPYGELFPNSSGGQTLVIRAYGL